MMCIGAVLATARFFMVSTTVTSSKWWVRVVMVSLVAGCACSTPKADGLNRASRATRFIQRL